MTSRQPRRSQNAKKHGAVLPEIWLMTDPRIDEQLPSILRHMPRGSAIIFRHYDLPPEERKALFGEIRQLAKRYGHIILLAGSLPLARKWKADGVHNIDIMHSKMNGLIRSAAVHSSRQARARRARNADVILVSPVFPTRSHIGGKTLGVYGFRSIALRSDKRVIALGGMTHKRARRLKSAYSRLAGWASIDALAAQYGKS